MALDIQIDTDPRAKSDADVCREKGWGPGTRLVGTEYYSDGKSNTCTIVITAVGEEAILARCDHPEHQGYEGMWTLSHREWRPVPEEREGSTGAQKAEGA